MPIRLYHLLSAIAVLLAGLASCRYRVDMLRFLAEYGGDTLWALMLFLVVSFVLAGRPILQRSGISLALAFAVKVSQLYHAPWIDRIRSTTLGGLVLGFGFLWSEQKGVRVRRRKPTHLEPFSPPKLPPSQ